MLTQKLVAIARAVHRLVQCFKSLHVHAWQLLASSSAGLWWCREPRIERLTTDEIQTLDETAKLERSSAIPVSCSARMFAVYRTGKARLPDCQRAISLLVRGMTAPTEKQMKNLKYLADYMYATRDYTLVLRWTTPGRSYLDQGIRERPRLPGDGSGSNSDAPAKQSMLLEAVSDSDWAGGSDRRSLSCDHLYLRWQPHVLVYEKANDCVPIFL